MNISVLKKIKYVVKKIVSSCPKTEPVGENYCNTPEDKRREVNAHKKYYSNKIYYNHYLSHPYMLETLSPFFPYLQNMINTKGHKNVKIVEIGSGGGIILSQIVREFKVKGYGFDLSFEGSKMANKNGYGKYFVGDAEDAPLKKQSADIVLLISTIHHFFRYPDRIIREAYNLLKEEGVLLIQEPNNLHESILTRRKVNLIKESVEKIYTELSILLGENGKEVKLPPPPPDLPTEGMVTLETVINVANNIGFKILKKGFVNNVAFIARKYPFGFGIAKEIDVILNTVAPKECSMYYIVAKRQ